jgi:hypothetical protein
MAQRLLRVALVSSWCLLGVGCQAGTSVGTSTTGSTGGAGPAAPLEGQPVGGTPASGGLYACPGDANDVLAGARQACVAAINGFRKSVGVAALQRDCSFTACADAEAMGDAQKNMPHATFGACKESAQNECPGWPNPPGDHIGGCLQQMWNEGPGSDYAVHGHYTNMSNGAYTAVECGYFVDANGFWGVQNFR